MKKQTISFIAGLLLMNTSFAQLSVNSTQTDVMCFGDANGAVQLSISGGVEPYSVYWTNGVTTTNMDGLNPGVYVAVVTDAQGATVVKSIVIDGPTEPLEITGTPKNTSAFGMNDGAIDLAVTGGSAFREDEAYHYTWSNGEVSEDLQDLNAGVYTVTVADRNSCTASKTFTILQIQTQAKKGPSSPVMLVPESNGVGSMVFRTNTEDYQLSETVVYNMDNGQFIPVNSEEGMVELNNLAPGKYLISARTADGEKVSRIFMVQ